MTETRVWFWLQIGVAVAVVLAGAIHCVVVMTLGDQYLAGFAYFMVYVDAFLFLPGLAISIVVNAFVIRAHGHAGPSRAEKVLLVVELGFILALLAFQIWMPYLLSPGMIVWAVLVIWAVVVLIVAGVRNSRIPREVRRGDPLAGTRGAPAVPGETLPSSIAP